MRALPPSPERIAAPGTEHAIQAAFFAAIARDMHKPGYGALRWVHAVPNGGERHPAIAGRMKAEGARKGVWDVCIPIPRGNAPFGYIEFKTAARRNYARGGLTDAQVEFGRGMLAQNAWMRVHYDWYEAYSDLLHYLGLTRST